MKSRPLITLALLPSFAAAIPLPLHTSGNQILDSHNRPVLLRGVDTASMEWTSNGEGHILKTISVAIQQWHANIIRLPLSQDRWFGKAPEQNGDFKPYRALIHQIVNECSSQNCYIILDLHWNDADQWGKNIGQHKMPDEYSLKFWKSFAPVYKNNPAVLFDLYNEPHDVSWDVWQNGGPISETDQKTGVTLNYQSPGMQALLNAVRSAGARNIAIVGGLNWAYDMSGFLDGHALRNGHGNGIIYANHNYPFKGETLSQWEAHMVNAAARVPVIVTEFGGKAPWVPQVLAIMEAHHWSWTAWDLHPKAGPDLISDWSYTPTSDFGVYVKAALRQPK